MHLDMSRAYRVGLEAAAPPAEAIASAIAGRSLEVTAGAEASSVTTTATEAGARRTRGFLARGESGQVHSAHGVDFVDSNVDWGTNLQLAGIFG